MLPLSQIESKQIPLIHIVHEGDVVLLNTPETNCPRVLYYFPWQRDNNDGGLYDSFYQCQILESTIRKNVARTL